MNCDVFLPAFPVVQTHVECTAYSPPQDRGRFSSPSRRICAILHFIFYFIFFTFLFSASCGRDSRGICGSTPDFIFMIHTSLIPSPHLYAVHLAHVDATPAASRPLPTLLFPRFPILRTLSRSANPKGTDRYGTTNYGESLGAFHPCFLVCGGQDVFRSLFFFSCVLGW